VTQEDDGRLDVTTAMARRRSTRAFASTPVEDSLLKHIVYTALDSPSGGNLQPWHVYVMTGQALDGFCKAVATRPSSQQQSSAYPAYPANLWEPYRSRRFENGEALYDAIGIERDDKKGRLRQAAKNFNFFGAPVGILLAIESRMGHSQWLDMGILMQSIMLLAVEQGLATCPQASWSHQSDAVKDILNLQGDLQIIGGIAMGYADPQDSINNWCTSRAKPDCVTFL